MTTTEMRISKKSAARSVEKEAMTAGRIGAVASCGSHFASAAASEPFTKDLWPEYDLVEVAKVVRESINKVQDGDMAGMEAMLVGQAQALQQVFVSLMRRAGSTNQMKQFQMYMGIGLKAQAQSRATVSALVELKYPRQTATFVKQANIAHGPQQVNNGTAGDLSHAIPPQPQQNELLEHSHDNLIAPRMDTRAPQAAERSYQTVGTVESNHGTEKPRG